MTIEGLLADALWQIGLILAAVFAIGFGCGVLYQHLRRHSPPP